MVCELEPRDVSGLTANHAYTFTLTATNPIGSAWAQSNTITAEPYDPSVSIGSPANGSACGSGGTVNTRYRCQDGTGQPGISSCTGTIASGVAVNTRAPGRQVHRHRNVARRAQHFINSRLHGARPAEQLQGQIGQGRSQRDHRRVAVVACRARDRDRDRARNRGAAFHRAPTRRADPTLKFKVPASKRLQALLKHRRSGETDDRLQPNERGHAGPRDLNPPEKADLPTGSAAGIPFLLSSTFERTYHIAGPSTSRNVAGWGGQPSTVTPSRAPDERLLHDADQASLAGDRR